MRNFFKGVTVVFFFIGFALPAFFILAVITAIAACFCSPPFRGLRPDGKPRTGGALGGFWDGFVTGLKMKECPYCKSDIPLDSLKCRHCGEWVAKKDESSTE
jgi:hypothetical protein